MHFASAVWLWIISCFSVWSQSAQADLHFTQYANQLSITNISSIVQDTSGFIWIGTASGLNRFDGLDFITYESSLSDSLSMTDNRVNDLLLDSKGQLWIATYQDLMQYNYEHTTFSVVHRKEDKGLAIDALDLVEDVHGRIWIGTLHGLYFLNDSQQLVPAPDTVYSTWHEDEVYQVTFDKQNNMWLGTNSGLFWIQDGSFTEIIAEKDILSIAHGPAFIWVGTRSDGLYRLSKTGEILDHYPLTLEGNANQNRVFDVHIQSNGEVWVGTEFAGLKRYLPDQNDFWSIQKGTSEGSLKSNSIWEIFEDRSGRMWLGTNNQGVFVEDPYYSKFQQVAPVKDGNVQLKFGTVSTFLEVDGRLWIGTDGGGISVYDSAASSFSFFDRTNAGGGLGSDEVLTFFQDSEGAIWVGNWGGGLNRFDPTTGEFTTFLHDENDPNSIGSNNVLAIREDDRGLLWCTTWGQGLSCFDRKTGQFDHIGYEPHNPNFLSSDLTYDLEVDREGNLWVATVLGLDKVVFTQDSFRVEHFDPDEEDPGSLSNINVNSILIDSKERLWVGTKFGLNLMRSGSDAFRRYFKEDGLIDNDIKDIIEDHAGNFWITTGKGLMRGIFTGSELSFEPYDESDGLLSLEFFNNATYRAKDGRIFLGGLNGFNHFHPDEVKQDNNAPEVQFTDLKLFNQRVVPGEEKLLKKHLNLMEKLTLTHGQSVFTIDYLAIHFTHAYKNQFAFQLEGLENQWNYVGSQRQATYTNLDAGDYLFKVKAANHDGVWGVERTLLIEVLPPWWETLWFRVLFLGGIITLVFSVFYFRVRFLKRQRARLQYEVARQTHELKQTNGELERLGQFKEMFTGMLVHDLKNPLHLILGLSEKEGSKTMREINQSGRRMLQMVSNMLDIQKFEETQMKTNAIDFDWGELVRESQLQFALLFKSKNLRFNNEVEQVGGYGDVELLSRVMANLLANAVKYTPFGGAITVKSEVHEGRVTLSVTDTGKGIPEDQQALIFDRFHQSDPRKLGRTSSTGLGLAFCKMVVEAHGGTIGVRSKVGAGATFYFDIQHSTRYVVQEEPSIEQETRNELTEKELHAIRQLRSELEVLQLYEVSKIEALIDGMPDTEPVREWKEAVKSAAYNWHEERFRELINL